jgi:hypothetical protein
MRTAEAPPRGRMAESCAAVQTASWEIAMHSGCITRHSEVERREADFSQ